jgi:hypothetical protein
VGGGNTITSVAQSPDRSITITGKNANNEERSVVINADGETATSNGIQVTLREVDEAMAGGLDGSEADALSNRGISRAILAMLWKREPACEKAKLALPEPQGLSQQSKSFFGGK